MTVAIQGLDVRFPALCLVNGSLHQLALAKGALQQHKADWEQIVQARWAKVQSAREAAEHASAAKSEFLALIAHELRAPLHGILSFARFGMKRYDDAPREKLLLCFERIQTSGRAMQSMLNELLDLAKVEAGAMTLECAPVDLSALAAEVLGEAAGIALDKNLTLKPARTRAAFVWGDRSKLAQVVRNLIGNSLKFAPRHGEIEVSIQPGVETWILQVRDDGPGIPDAECEAVFGKFVQSPHIRSEAHGAGLGLAICRELIALHRGRIWATPTHGQGALLQVELPRWEALPGADLSGSNKPPERLEADALPQAPADVGPRI